MKKAAQTPMLTGKHSDPFSLEKRDDTGMDFFAEVLL